MWMAINNSIDVGLHPWRLDESKHWTPLWEKQLQRYCVLVLDRLCPHLNAKRPLSFDFCLVLCTLSLPFHPLYGINIDCSDHPSSFLTHLVAHLYASCLLQVENSVLLQTLRPRFLKITLQFWNASTPSSSGMTMRFPIARQGTRHVTHHTRLKRS